ncbi:kinesin-like protein KIF9 [Hydractinia symbiolongicarpus]|uniref:kinesin-like protein KIF9 n=1 Tax=Hydractinia symbiolongicarpus TaxID=13093 RepID=UPI00254AD16B|nr:kinesin-like protein KIF9 [Hydractinia symbiolongicarpus]
MISSSNEHIQVYLRIKPSVRFANDCIDLVEDLKSLNIHAEKEKQNVGYINNQISDWHFQTDGILHNASQEEVYKTCTSGILKNALDGYNNTLFVYGQTGAGKTYTITGTTNNFQNRGITPRLLSDLYEEINKQKHEYDITVRISYLEIYKEEMFDLLATLHPERALQELVIVEDEEGGTYVKGLACHIAQTEEDALNFLFEGESNRIISQHQLNKASSRSHCIFTIYIESHSKTDSETKYTTSKINLVDLAGSERLGKTLSTGETQAEAMYINKSLTFLEQAIIALEDRRRQHVPYRQSKLTHVLKDTIGGSCNTVMIANIWGTKTHIEETLSTLRFAARVMHVPVYPAVNSFYNPVLLCKEYEKEIGALRKELAMYDTLTNRNQINYEPLSDIQIKDIRQQVKRYIDDDISEIAVLNLRQVKEVFTQFKNIIVNLQTEIEEKLREKYDIYEKVDSPEKVSEVTPPTAEKTGLVGESDGNSFGVGRAGNGVKPAVPSAVANTKKKGKRTKDTPEPERRISSPPVQNTPPQNEQKISVEDIPSVVSVDAGERASTPPSKQEAFEMFKSDYGKKLSTIFQENKDILRDKKNEAKTISACINETKLSIDETKIALEELTVTREYGEDRKDDVILDEDEFHLIQKLKGLKSTYRMNYEHLQNLHSDIFYCEKLVKQCRQQLLAEFQVWYEASFGVKEEADVCLNTTNSKMLPDAEKEANEKSEKIATKYTCPGSMAFYNARTQTNLRKLGAIRKRPGSVTSTLRNAPPPNSMIIH